MSWDVFAAGLMIGLALGVIVGSVPVFNAWQAERDAEARR